MAAQPFLARAGDLLKTAVSHYFTGPDGETYAPGRATAIVLFLVGLPLPYVAMFAAEGFSLTEAGLYYGGLAGACTALITLTNSTEPPAPPASPESPPEDSP